MSDNSYNLYLRAETSSEKFQTDDGVNRILGQKKIKKFSPKPIDCLTDNRFFVLYKRETKRVYI